MLIHLDKLQQSIEKSREINEQFKLYSLDSENRVKPVDNLIKLCQEYLKKDIKLYEHKIPHTGQPIRGFYLAYPDYYEIVLLGEQNFCWRRLVLCKEIFHIILDDEEYQNKDIGRLIDEATITLPIYKNDADPILPMQAELFAEIAAMEFLFPYNERKSILNKSQSPDYMLIAEQYKIPRFLVEKYLSKSAMNSLCDI